MRRCYEAASLVQHSGKSRLGSSSSRSVSSTLLPSLLLLLLITISLYTWMEKKRLNKQILFLNPHHHHHLLCLWFLFIPPMSEMFSAWLSPPCTSWLMVVGDWFIIYFFPHYIGLPGRHTRFPVGTMFPIQWRTIWKSLLRVRFSFLFGWCNQILYLWWWWI